MPYKFTFMFILQNLGRLSGKNTQYSRKKRKYYRHRLKQNQLFLNPAYFIEAISDSFTQIPITYLRGKEEFWGGGHFGQFPTYQKSFEIYQIIPTLALVV